jgi:hypothetical protein
MYPKKLEEKTIIKNKIRLFVISKLYRIVEKKTIIHNQILKNREGLIINFKI